MRKKQSVDKKEIKETLQGQNCVQLRHASFLGKLCLSSQGTTTGEVKQFIVWGSELKEAPEDG